MALACIRCSDSRCKVELPFAVQVPLMVACTAPFLSGPRVQIGYALGKQVVNQNLALPVITPKFCTPPDSSVPREAFFQRWRTLEGGLPINPSSCSFPWHPSSLSLPLCSVTVIYGLTIYLSSMQSIFQPVHPIIYMWCSSVHSCLPV